MERTFIVQKIPDVTGILRISRIDSVEASDVYLSLSFQDTGSSKGKSLIDARPMLYIGISANEEWLYEHSYIPYLTINAEPILRAYKIDENADCSAFNEAVYHPIRIIMEMVLGTGFICATKGDLFLKDDSAIGHSIIERSLKEAADIYFETRGE